MTPDPAKPSPEAAQPVASASGDPAHAIEPRPLDLTSPQFTPRAVLTGMTLAALLSMCNIYTGLKIGWSLNMSITAALLSFGFWKILEKTARTREWGILENNVNQTAASSGASVSSAGLVAPIPALAMLTGQTLGWPYLALWVFSVCLVGITVAVALRRQMILEEKLPFVSGIASGETLKEMYAHGAEAMKRVQWLAGAGVVAGILKYATDVKAWFSAGIGYAGAVSGIPLSQLTFRFDTNLLMYGVGALIGLRACVSLLIGAVLAWAIVAPAMLNQGKIRLEVSEPLPILPPGVVLPAPPDGYAAYDAQAGRIRFQGIMTAAERDGLLAQSDDPAWTEVVHRLWMRSDRHSEAPADPSRWTTTRPLQFRESVGEVPYAFDLPRRLTSRVQMDRSAGTLVALGAMSDGTRAEVRAIADEVQAAEPRHAAAMDRVRAALDALHVASNAPRLPEGRTASVFGDGSVEYDDLAKTVRVTGLLPAEGGALAEAASALGLSKETVDSLKSGARFSSIRPDFRDLVTWLLWPGVTLMVVASLLSFAFSWRSIAGSFRRRAAGGPAEAASDDVPRNVFIAAIVAALILSTVLQVSLFAIVWWTAALGVLVTFVLALVAGRVSGETNITPVGAMGKVTQLMFGLIAPSQPAPNLMAANVTGGASSQCADLLHDLKTGWLLGASPRLQAMAQVCGALAGAMAGSFVYLILFPRPADQLMTGDWPAPAVATWKAVAELFQVGLQAIPEGTPAAMLVAAVAAVVLVLVEKLAPAKWRKWTLSPASLGLAFVVHAHYSVTMFLGAVIGLLLARANGKWTSKYLVVVCAGIVAGESLTGVGIAFTKIDFATILERIFG